MDLMEITEKERLSRKDAAARLRSLADALAKKNDVEFESGALNLKVRVPDEVDFKLEIEIDDDEIELEVELKWSANAAPAPAPATTPAGRVPHADHVRRRPGGGPQHRAQRRPRESPRRQRGSPRRQAPRAPAPRDGGLAALRRRLGPPLHLSVSAESTVHGVSRLTGQARRPA